MIMTMKATGLRARSTAILLVVAAALGGFVASCGDDDDNGDASDVGVKLDEFFIALDGEPSAGGVTFGIENIGEETHEFVVFRTELALTALPTADDGSVDEEGAGVELVDEAEDIAAGDSVQLTVDLDAGSYVVICNIVEEDGGETESHYQEGMRASFTVE